MRDVFKTCIGKLSFKSFLRLAVIVLLAFFQANNNADCQRRRFQGGEKKPYNYYRIVDDPDQVKPDLITRDNLFGWLNLKNRVRFKLWTRNNPHLAHEIKYNNVETLRTSNFDAHRVTKILLHGFADSANEIAITYYLLEMRDAYLRMNDVNVIIVDYSLFAIPVFYWTSFPTLAAERFTEFLHFMIAHGNLKLKAVHLVGFSWGAHVAGLAGHSLKGQVGRITGLDPAGPTFRYLENEDRLDKSDATFVDIIHTNGGNRLLFGANFGLPMPLGHVDVYPNGGQKQIGCPLTTPLVYETLECSHGRSARYFIESITSPLAFPLPCPCNDFEKFVRNECKCKEEDYLTFMGEHMSHSTRGIYQLITKAQKPFGHGPYMNISLSDVIKPNDKTSSNRKKEILLFGFPTATATKTTEFPAKIDRIYSSNEDGKNEFLRITYENVTNKVQHRNTFNTKEYPNDDIIYACLLLFLKNHNKN